MEFGPWNPGIESQVPEELRHLSTLFRPEYVFTSLERARELRDLTGLDLREIVAFRPQRLLLHEVLIRVTADFSVPDGSRIEDLGINFREITSHLLTRYLDPQMDSIAAAFAQVRRQLAEAIQAAFSTVTAGSPPSVTPPAHSPA